MNRYQRLIRRERKTLGKVHPDKQRSDESGSVGHGYRVYIVERAVGGA